jgi:hypothetical protein
MRPSFAERTKKVDDGPFVCHTFGRMLGPPPPLMLDFSGERCARSVLALATMTRNQLEMHLEQTAQASASVLVVRARRPKPEKIPRNRRRDRWR